MAPTNGHCPIPPAWNLIRLVELFSIRRSKLRNLVEKLSFSAGRGREGREKGVGRGKRRKEARKEPEAHNIEDERGWKAEGRGYSWRTMDKVYGYVEAVKQFPIFPCASTSPSPSHYPLTLLPTKTFIPTYVLTTVGFCLLFLRSSQRCIFHAPFPISWNL